jgi:hypothetical protein
MVVISKSLTEGASEDLLLCRGSGSGNGGCDQPLSKEGLGSADEVSSLSSSRCAVLLSLRVIDFPGLRSPTADLHVLETNPLNLRTLIRISPPN